jgi:hypothetical protein
MSLSSYPPGCHSVPGDKPQYCSKCAQPDENCVCEDLNAAVATLKYMTEANWALAAQVENLQERLQQITPKSHETL